MENSTLDIIKLLAIVTASIFSIAGIITETKNKKTGKFTLWGYVALAGVIVTNSFQFIQTYIEQQDEIQKLHQANSEMQKESDRYINQVKLLYRNIHEADQSLAQQKKIQYDTKGILTGTQRSLGLERSALKQSKVLINKQKEATVNIEKTLNPLIPFRMNVYFKINADSIEGRDLKVLNEDFQKQINKYFKGYNDGIYITFPEDYEPVEYDITTESPFFEKFVKCFSTNPDLGIDFSKKNNNTTKFLFVISPKEFFTSQNLKDNFSIRFVDKCYIIGLFNIPCGIRENDGFKSSDDLLNTELTILFNSWFEKMDLERVEFKFPPDFSNIKEVQISSKNKLKKFNTDNYFVIKCSSFIDTYEKRDLDNL